MELDADKAGDPRLGDDAFGCCGRRRSLGDVRVGEIIRLAAWVDRRPADPRHPALVQSHRPARKKPEALHAAVLVALLEGELEPQADAERRPAAGDPRAERLVEPALAQDAHRARCGPHAGKTARSAAATAAGVSATATAAARRAHAAR